MADVVCEEYSATLRDLTFNSKPHISMLTMLAEENQQYAPKIVQAIEAHLQKVRPETKLPSIYLIDSIVKNVGGAYLGLFTQNLVSTFCSVFEKVDERTRIQLFKLRQTWSDVFPAKKLHAIDLRVRQMDPAWPVAAQSSIHVNPKFLKQPTIEDDLQKNQEIQEAEMRKQLIAKQQELLKLQQQKLELELLQTKAKLEEQKKLLHPPAKTPSPSPPPPAPIPPPVTRPFQAVKEPSPVRRVEPPQVRKIETPKPQVPVPVKSAVVLPHPPPMPVLTTSRPQSVVIPPKDPRVLRDPRLSRDPRSSFQPALVPVNAGSIPAVPVTNKRNTDKMFEKAHVNLTVPSNHAPRSGNFDPAVPNLHNRETLKSAVVLQPPRSSEKKTEPSVKNDRTLRKKVDNETKKSSPKSDVKIIKSSPVKEGSKKDAKKKSETPSPKKNVVVHKKDDLLKQTVDKPKPVDKIKKPKSEGKLAIEPLKERRGSSRNLGSSSTRPDHGYKNDDLAGKGGGRPRRNYRTNRNRSAAALDAKLASRLEKLAEKDDGGDTTKERSGVRARSRSPIRPNRNADRDDKKAERNTDKAKKKIPRKDTENSNSGVAVKDAQKPGLKDLNIDVDLRAVNSNSPKHTDKSMNSDVDAKENVDASPSGEEPPSKKLRPDEESNLDTLFGSKDQDYRQIPPNTEQGGQQLESPGNHGWAKYKAEHPEEFKNPTTPRSLKENVRRESYSFGSFDQDFRMAPRDEYNYPQENSGEATNRRGFYRGRNRRGFPNEPRGRGFGRGRGRFPGRHVDDPRVLQRHPIYQRLYSREENAADPNLDIPHALLLNKQAEILRQADQQLKSGHLTRDQHQELLNQLGKLYELQTLRQKQKEEEFKEKVFLRNENQRRNYPQFGRGRPPHHGGPRFPHDGPRFPHDGAGKQFSAGSDLGQALEPHQMKFNRRQPINMRTRQNEVLHGVVEEVEHAQRNCQGDDLEVVDMDVVREEDKPLPVKSPTESSQIRNIVIDGNVMGLMFFGTVGVVFTNAKEPPKEITFKGPLQEVYVDGYVIPLGFGGDTVIADIEGKSHRFRFGAPTREIYIDDVPYEIQFGGPHKPIILANKPRLLRLSGPPPDVEFVVLRQSLQSDVAKVMPFETGFTQNTDVSASNANGKGQSAERPKDEVNVIEAASKPVVQLIELEAERANAKEPTTQDSAENSTEADSSRDRNDGDSKTSLSKPENENRDVDLRSMEAAPRPSTSTHRESPIPTPAPPQVADSEQGRRGSPAHFTDSPSRSPVYRGSFPSAPRPDYHEFRAVHSEEGDKDYRDIRTFSQVDRVIFKEEPMDTQFQRQDKPRETWPEPWRENTNRYLDAPAYRGEQSQPGGYNPHEQMPPRDEYIPEFWHPPHMREEEFQRKQTFFRDRGGRQNSPQRGRQNSPQRVPSDYPHYQDVRPPPLPHESGMRMDFPAFRPNSNMGNRMDGVRPRYEPMRPPFEPPPSMPFDMPQPRFDNPLRPNLGERGPAVQPQPQPPNFYPIGPPGNQRPPFPDERPPEFFPPIAERPGFAPLSSVLPAGTPVNQGGLPSVPPPFILPPQLDVAELFQKLVAAGIVSKSTEAAKENASDAAVDSENKEKAEEKEPVEEKIPKIEFTSESLRGHYAGVIGNLFRGIQCSSCGLRFTSEQTEKYALHLDWHFRQNRRDRDGVKKAVSRKWYYDVQDWIQYEEIEDMEDRSRSLFEAQANEEAIEHIDDLHTVPVGENDEDNTCVVCGEPFEQFWDQEKEEWHLRDSLRVEKKTYHPGCFEDIKNVAVTEPTSEAVVPEKPVRVSWQDKPEKKTTEEKKSETPAENKAATEAGKIKQEKMDTEEPVTTTAPDPDVVIKQEKDLTTAEGVTTATAATEDAPIVSEAAGEADSVGETSIAMPLQPVSSSESLAPEPSTAVLPSDGVVARLADNTSEMASVESAVVPLSETSVEPPVESSVALTAEPPVVEAVTTSDVVEPMDVSETLPTAPPTQEATDLAPVDEMDRLQVKVEPLEEATLLNIGETPECNIESQALPVEPSDMDTTSREKQPPVESDERTLLFPAGVKIKQEPVEHDETTVSELPERTTAETNIQKPPSPLGETIEKVLEGSNEAEASVDDAVTPTPGFTVFPPVMRGTELSGLCSIM